LVFKEDSMRKFLAFSSVIGSVALYHAATIALPKLGLIALLAAGGATLLTSLSNTAMATFITFFLAFFSQGGTTPPELLLAF
jgi:hypothetical protein